MYILVTYKNEDQMKNECTRMVKSLDIIELYFRHSVAAYSIVGGQVWLKIKLIEALIVVLDTCKNDENPSKNEGTSVLTTLFLRGLVKNN